MANFSLSAMPESSKAKPQVDAKVLAELTARAIFLGRGRTLHPWVEVHLTFDELIDILRGTIEAARN
jgi:hypothetical protein